MMRDLLKSFAADKTGATAIEYGLIAALIAITIVPALLLFTDKFKATYEYLTRTLAGS